MIKAAEDASGAERSFLLLEKRAEAEREENRCLGAQKDLRISELEKQVCYVASTRRVPRSGSGVVKAVEGAPWLQAVRVMVMVVRG